MFESEFTTHGYRIKFEKFGEPYYLIPFGDVHRYADNCHEDAWLSMLDWCKKKMRETKGRVYFLGMGDYDDLASTSERFALQSAKLHATTKQSLDDHAEERVMKLCKELSFMKGRLIGLIEGNHHYAFMSGISSTQMMAQILGTKYLGVMSYIRLNMDYAKGQRSYAMDILAYHGSGGGKRIGSSVNNVEDLARICDAQIYLSGHDHRKWVVLQSKLCLKHGNGKLRLNQKKILLGRTGSFQLGYRENKKDYVSSSAMSPSDIGVIKIELTPRWKTTQGNGKKEEDSYIDIHASI